MAETISKEWLAGQLEDIKRRLEHLEEKGDATAEGVARLEVQAASVNATTAEKAKAGEEACAARHGSAAKRLGRLEGLVGIGAMAAIGACVKLVWDAVTGSGKAGG